MTQEQKNLLLKDLCSRLPYGVKVQSYSYEDDIETVETLYNIDSDGYMSTLECDTLKNITKPYLFPLSSMTEEQKEELNNIFDLDVEIAITHIKNDTPNYFTGLNRLNWFIKNHFDIYGLIPMGLAEDATGLNIY